MTEREQDVVERLVDDLAPVRRPRSPWVRLAGWLVLALTTVALAGAFGLRHDLGQELVRTRYDVTLAVLLAGAGLGATVALLAAIPGRIAGRQARAVGAGLLALALTAAFLGEPGGAPTGVMWLLEGMRCTVCVALFAFVPWIVLIGIMRRGAPLEGGTAALCAGTAACLVGAACVRVACPYDDTLHLAIWHGLPVMGWSIVSALVAGPRLSAWIARA